MCMHHSASIYACNPYENSYFTQIFMAHNISSLNIEHTHTRTQSHLSCVCAHSFVFCVHIRISAYPFTHLHRSRIIGISISAIWICEPIWFQLPLIFISYIFIFFIFICYQLHIFLVARERARSFSLSLFCISVQFYPVYCVYILPLFILVVRFVLRFRSCC